MLRKIIGLFKKKSKVNKTGKLNFEKAVSGLERPNEIDVFDEFSQRLPGFPLGIPVIPVELLIERNKTLIKDIILARGLAGVHNKDEVEHKIMSPIRHLSEMTHLLPASQKNHFKLIGGLFSFCLEVSLMSIRYAERRILTRATPEIRREEESLWTHAAFLNGLFSPAVTAISSISVYAEGMGVEWRPGGESLYKWLIKNQLERYHIRWNDAEDRSTVYIMVGMSMQKEQTDIFAAGEKAIYKTLYAALQDQADHSNPLASIYDTVKYKIMERDEWTYADRYGKPLHGMHLEAWLVDAMRTLVQKKRWVPNEENGRVWHGRDGVFLVWPLAANDMKYEMKSAECPFVPNTEDILAEIMLEAGIISKNILGGYLFDISVPVADSKDKKSLDALKLTRYETIFAKYHHKPIDDNLCIIIENVEEDEDSHNNEQEKIIEEKKKREKEKTNKEWDEVNNQWEEAKNQSKMQFNKGNTKPDNKNKESLGIDDSDTTRNKSGGNEFLLENGNEDNSTNQYDDDYASDYYLTELVTNKSFDTENINKAKKNTSSKPRKTTKNIKDVGKETNNIEMDEGVNSLIGSLISSTPRKKPSSKEVKEDGQVDLVLNKLKNLSGEYLQGMPNGITKVIIKGIKSSSLELNDCISVLKRSDLIELVEGRETGVEQSGKSFSRYFLVRANLSNGS